MGSVVELYEALASAPDERARARVIAEAFERLEERYPHLPDLVTRQHLAETELRLQKEIELVRKETAQIRAELDVKIEQMRGEVKTEIEQLRGELRETELRLQKEIQQLRGEVKTEIEQLRGELRETELRLQKEIQQLRGEVKTEIEQLRGELRETELRLQKEIQQLRGELKTEIEQLRGEMMTAIERSRNTLLMLLIPLMFAQVGAIAALVKLL